jgi:hypothetical protein
VRTTNFLIYLIYKNSEILCHADMHGRELALRIIEALGWEWQSVDLFHTTLAQWGMGLGAGCRSSMVWTRDIFPFP